MHHPPRGAFRDTRGGVVPRPDDADGRDEASDWREILGSVLGGLFGEPARFDALMDSIEHGRRREAASPAPRAPWPP